MNQTGIRIIDAKHEIFGPHYATFEARLDANGRIEVHTVRGSESAAELQSVLDSVHCELQYRMTVREFWLYVIGWCEGKVNDTLNIT